MSTSELSAISGAPLSQRMRWYAELNCWRVPNDFPVALPEFGEDIRAQHTNPEWRAAWDSVRATLTDEQSSLGWWLHGMDATPAEWRAWWVGERRRSADAADALIAELAGASA